MTVGTTPYTAANKPVLHDFRMDQVSITDPYFMNAFAKKIQYLKSYDPDRLLAGFRRTKDWLPKPINIPAGKIQRFAATRWGVGLTPTDFRNAYAKRLLFYE
jgi:uncharacterized protein